MTRALKMTMSGRTAVVEAFRGVTVCMVCVCGAWCVGEWRRKSASDGVGRP
jgi:hypothetical protein